VQVLTTGRARIDVWLAGTMSHLTPVPSDPDGLEAWLNQRRADDVDLGFEWHNPEIELPPAPDEPLALTVHVSLQDTEPPVWRRLVVPGDTALDDLHDILQTAMGWTDSHLHRFFVSTSRGAPHFVTPWDRREGATGTPEEDVRLDQLLGSVGDTALYEYDFGDSWDHELRLEATAPLPDDARARCTGGAGACPPEDVGGVPGYEEVADWVRAGRRARDVPPRFDSYEHAVRWLPADWHPDTFDVADTDRRLQALATSADILDRVRTGAIGAIGHLSPDAAQTVSAWIAAAARTSLSAADLEELASPYRILLDAIGDGVELTASGYLPTQVVASLWPALHVEPALAGRSNREHNIRPLLMFRTVAQHAGLVRVVRRRAEPTALARRVEPDAGALWAHVAAQLPHADDELSSDVGWFTLLALAGGVPHQELYDEVQALCAEAGWTAEDGDPVDPYVISGLMWPTLAAVIGARWNSRKPWPRWVPAAAASVIFGGQPG
jgi:hypothetical protein